MLPYVTQYNKRYILSTFEKIEIGALSNRRFNQLSNDTIFYTLCFVHYLWINLADKMYLLLYWVTYFKCCPFYGHGINILSPTAYLCYKHSSLDTHWTIKKWVIFDNAFGNLYAIYLLILLNTINIVLLFDKYFIWRSNTGKVYWKSGSFHIKIFLCFAIFEPGHLLLNSQFWVFFHVETCI